MGKNWKDHLVRSDITEWLSLFLLLVFPFLGYLPHPTLLLTGMVCVTLGLWLWQWKTGKYSPDFSALDLLVLLSALSFFLSGTLTFGSRTAFFEGLVKALLLLFYFPSVAFFCRSKWRERGFFALQFSGGIAAFLGILQYFRGKALLQWVDLQRFSDIGGRVTGGFGNPNVFSIYLLLVFPISLVMLCKGKESLESRLFAFLCLCAELLCLILTWSRGAWLGAMLSIFLFLLFFSHRTRRWLLIIPIPVFVVCFYLPHNIVNRFQSIGNLSESSIQYRLFVWKGVWRMLCHHPFGIGMGREAFTAHYLPYAVKGTETVIHTHQIFFQILCELGIIGLILFLSFLAILFYQLIKKSRRTQDDDTSVIFGGGLALLGALAAGMFDNIWYHSGVFCLFWVMAALAASALKNGRS